MASWESENFSTAELSPPISPAPLSPFSPSLYNNGGISPNPATATVSGKDGLKYTATDYLAGSRAQLASNLLRDLADFESIKYDSQNDLGLNWNEESVNLELFSELSELDYVSPATPVSEEFTNQQNVSQFVETITIPTSPLEQPEYSPEVYDKLSAEFQAILESLPPANAGNTSTDEFDDLIAISGIPAPAHFQETQQCITNTTNNSFMESQQAVVVNDSSMLMDLDFTGNGNNYSGVISLDETSNNSHTSAASIFYAGAESDGGAMNISEEILEENADAAEKILDALLLGNLVEAQSFLPSMLTLPIDNAITFNAAAPIEVIAIPSTSAVVQSQEAKPKSETKRTKSSGGRRRNGLNTIVDKSLRKKEQNKTAATRYRLKKKMESVETSEVENKMQAENDVLQAESNDLARQITIVKQLLRDIMESKKSTKNNNLNRRSF